MPPTAGKMNYLFSNATGTEVLLKTLNWYLDRRETSPTLVCIRPNRIPGNKMVNSKERMLLLFPLLGSLFEVWLGKSIDTGVPSIFLCYHDVTISLMC
jgi:hypothetical protein